MDESRTTRVTVEEAARLLGIEKGSVKKRIQRGKIRSEKDTTGATWVYMDTSETVRDKSAGRSQTDRDELVEELRRTNELLQEVITTRDEEIRRRDTIIMNMTEAVKALNPPAPENSSEAREFPEDSGPSDELGEVREELGTERTRRETAEATLHEGMAEERRRREEAERERDDLRRVLYARREPQESPETVEGASEEVEPTSYAVEVHGSSREATEAPEAAEEQQGRGEPHPATGGAQEGARMPWWRRVFGG